MPRFQAPLRAGVAAFVLAIGAVSAAPSAMAQSGISLPSSSLADSLNALSLQTGVQILYDQALLRGKKAPAIRTETSVEAALTQLLRGSGLRYQKRGDAFLIVRGSGAVKSDAHATFDQRRTNRGAAALGTKSVSDTVNSSDTIVVTGTRLARPELDSPMPVNVVRMDEATQFGRVNAYEALKMSNASGLGVELGSSFGQNYDVGISAVSLRNLGANRSLTLIDGMRRVSSSARSSAVDLNMIPAAMIDRIEVVTGGAAAIYGADAVTGVVNVVTKDAIRGIHFTATNGISQRGDANEFSASLATGAKFADGRGSIVVGGTFYKTDPLIMSDRFPNWINSVPNPENTGINDGRPDNVTILDMRQIYFDYRPTFWFGGQSWIVDNGIPRQADFDKRFTAGEMGYGDGGDGRNLNDTAQLRGSNGHCSCWTGLMTSNCAAAPTPISTRAKPATRWPALFSSTGSASCGIGHLKISATGPQASIWYRLRSSCGTRSILAGPPNISGIRAVTLTICCSATPHHWAGNTSA